MGHDTRRIWIGCLASYNGGNLFGDWFDMDDHADLESLRTAIKAMLKRSPYPNAEEWHLCDHEGWAGLRVDRYPCLGELWEWHEAFEEHGHLPAAVIAHAITDGSGSDLAESLEMYRGEYESPGDYAAEFHESCGTEIPEWLANYVDYQRMEHDWECGGDIHIVRLDGNRTVWSTH